MNEQIDDIQMNEHLDGLYIKRLRDTLHLTLEDVPDVDFKWYGSEIRRFDYLWKKDVPIKEIALELGKSEFSVLLQALDRLIRGVIQPRKGWRIW